MKYVLKSYLKKDKEIKTADDLRKVPTTALPNKQRIVNPQLEVDLVLF